MFDLLRSWNTMQPLQLLLLLFVCLLVFMMGSSHYTTLISTWYLKLTNGKILILWCMMIGILSEFNKIRLIVIIDIHQINCCISKTLRLITKMLLYQNEFRSFSFSQNYTNTSHLRKWAKWWDVYCNGCCKFYVR